MASAGESVNNARSTSMFTPLLSSLNVAGGGVAFGAAATNAQIQGEEFLARAFIRGAAALPPQKVSVKEIVKTMNRLSVLESITP